MSGVRSYIMPAWCSRLGSVNLAGGSASGDDGALDGRAGSLHASIIWDEASRSHSGIPARQAAG